MQTVNDIARQKLGLPAIPPATCPLIDGVIDGIKDAIRLCNPGRGRYGTLTAEELGDAIDTCLSGLENTLETIRKHNETLRDLGEEWYETARDMAKESDSLRDTIENFWK